MPDFDPTPIRGAQSQENTAATSGQGAMDSSSNTVAAGQLHAFIERVERLEEEKKAVTDDIKEVYGEMKGVGFDVKAVRRLVALRKKDEAQRQEEDAMLHLYMEALGMDV